MTDTTARTRFLDRVRAAACQGRQHRLHDSAEISPGAGYVGGGADKLSRFAEELQTLGAFPTRAASAADAVDRLCQLAKSHAVRTVIRWDSPVLQRLDVDQALAAQGVEVFSWSDLVRRGREEARRICFAADLGLSGVDWALAESGTLAVRSLVGQGISVSLLPPVHVAIVEAHQVLPDLFDLFEILGREGLDRLPSNLTLITGPSKTGDIELNLTTGVHGPGELHIILLET